MTSWPSRQPFYPHVIVEEGGDVRDRVDRRGNLMAGEYDVQVTIAAESATDLYKIRDQVKKWVLDNIGFLNDSGFAEARIVSSTTGDWDTTSSVLVWRLVVRGLVHSI